MLTFTLLITLLLPDGADYTLTAGANLTRAQCDAASVKAIVQLESTLSVAQIGDVRCVEERGA